MGTPIFKVIKFISNTYNFLKKGLNCACIRGFFNTNVSLYNRFILRYVILLLTLIILSGSFGFSLAKGKGFEGGFPESSGLGNYRIGNLGKKSKPDQEIQYDQSEEKSSIMVNQEIQFDQRKEKSFNNQKASEDSESSKIRFRGLSGTYTSDFQEATSSTGTIIWDKLGIGQSVFKLKTSISGDTYEIENTLIEISYTFGDEFTLTLGGRSVTTGKLTITSSDSEIFNSSNVEGSGYFSVLGIEFGIFEILAGFQYTSYVFTEVETESTSAYWGSFEDSGGLYVTGIGLAF